MAEALEAVWIYPFLIHGLLRRIQPFLPRRRQFNSPSTSCSPTKHRSIIISKQRWRIGYPVRVFSATALEYNWCR